MNDTKVSRHFVTKKDDRGQAQACVMYGTADPVEKAIEVDDCSSINDLGEGTAGGRWHLYINRRVWISDELSEVEAILFKWFCDEGHDDPSDFSFMITDNGGEA